MCFAFTFTQYFSKVQKGDAINIVGSSAQISISNFKWRGKGVLILFFDSRTGYVIMYAGCPIIWKSSMQSLIALSTTEAEYIALSSALREVIAVMNLMNELKRNGFKLHPSLPTVRCRTFEDNKSCIEIATNHKSRPRTKHLSVRLHHFRSHIGKTINIEHISTKEQIADMFTKPLPLDQFVKLRDRLMGWKTNRKRRNESTEEHHCDSSTLVKRTRFKRCTDNRQATREWENFSPKYSDVLHVSVSYIQIRSWRKINEGCLNQYIYSY